MIVEEEAAAAGEEEEDDDGAGSDGSSIGALTGGELSSAVETKDQGVRDRAHSRVRWQFGETSVSVVQCGESRLNGTPAYAMVFSSQKFCVIRSVG